MIKYVAPALHDRVSLLQKHDCRNAPKVTDLETGETVCSRCGIVLERHVEQRAKRAKDHSGLSSHSQTSMRLSDFGISGKIGTKNKDYSGKNIPARAQSHIKRLKVLDSRTRSGHTSNRNLRIGLGMVDTISEKISIGKTATEKAAYFFRKTHNLGMSRGRSIREMAAACVYISCRFNRIPRNLTEISKAGYIRRTSLAKMYRAIHMQIDIRSEPHSPENFVSKVASGLEIRESVRRKAIHILREAKRKRVLAGKRPLSLATAALYVACKQSNANISLRKFTKVSKSSTNTIRGLGKTLENIIDI